MLIPGTTVASDGPESGRRRMWAVHFEVSVPRQSDLTAETVNGPVAAQDVAGRLDLRTVNGPLVLGGVSGDVHAGVLRFKRRDNPLLPERPILLHPVIEPERHP